MNTATGSLETNTPASTDGYTVGQSANDLVGFYGIAPIVQPTSANEAAASATAATTTSPWGYATSTQANAVVTLVNQLRADLVALGLIKGA